MSDAIPDEFMEKARNILESINFAVGWNPREQREYIARALMAAAKEADEVATKRVIGFIDKQAKEHSAQLARYRRDGETTGAFGQGEAILALSELRAAILRGDA